MLTRSGPPPTAVAPAHALPDVHTPGRRALGLLAASIYPRSGDHPALTFVVDLDESAIARVRRESLALRMRHRTPVTVELRYVVDARATTLVASLADLAAHDIAVVSNVVGGKRLHAAEPIGLEPAGEDPGPDPFGIDLAFRARVVPFLRFMFERYWRTQVSGLEHVPANGPALVVANHSGAVPADAFMMATALELGVGRRLRMLYDKFVDALPVVGPVYRRLGGVTASLPNAERLLHRGELIGLFPEGISGVEKRCAERYQLRPFKTGTARLSIRTGSPVVPVAIVGAEEAYPVIARLYRAGRLVGIPWIPITPTFPLCGVAGALPLPTKWMMHFGKPLMPPPDDRPEDARVAELTARIRDAIAGDLRVLLAKRSGIFL